jgi:hypothetical protein
MTVQECEISWSNLCRITGEFINMHNIPMPYENTVTATWDKSRMAEAQTMGASGASGRFASPRPS